MYLFILFIYLFYLFIYFICLFIYLLPEGEKPTLETSAFLRDNTEEDLK